MPLPPHATVVDGPHVSIEPDAIDQLGRVACSDGCTQAVGMPDLHPGPGIPIGAVFAFRDVLWPHLVGGDAGCGVRVIGLPRLKFQGDALERRARREFERPPLRDVDPHALMVAVWTHGARGLAEVDGVPEALREIASDEPLGEVTNARVPDAMFARQLGTIGGGNHFCELGRVDTIVDRDSWKAMGIGRYAVLVHSGSRGIGAHLARQWGAQPMPEGDAAPWLAELRGALNVAAANRLVIGWRLLTALGAGRRGRIGASLDIVHNTVVKLETSHGPHWVHRKGAAPAGVDQPTVVLGSRGTPSWILRGTGSEATLGSVAHGAGRRWSRADAIARVRARYRRSDLTRTTSGGRVICDDRDSLHAEHPDCYKPIEPVVTALTAAGAAHRIASLQPILTIKQ